MESMGEYRGGLSPGSSVAQMAAHVAHEIDPDAPLTETPLPVAALEAVTVPTADDGLQSQAGYRLQHGEIRTRDRRARLFVGLDGDIEPGQNRICRSLLATFGTQTWL
jgi:hypothetical protein